MNDEFKHDFQILIQILQYTIGLSFESFSLFLSDSHTLDILTTVYTVAAIVTTNQHGRLLPNRVCDSKRIKLNLIGLHIFG